MPATPKTKASELIEKINALLHQEERDEFTLRKTKSEAENLRSSDAFSAYVSLGMLASLENDENGMRKNHLAALKLQPNDSNGNLNYSTSLNNLGFYSEAKEYAHNAYEGNRGNSTILSYLIERCFKSGRVSEARNWLEKWETEFPKGACESKEIILKASKLLDSHGVNDDDVEKLVNLSSSVLHRHQIYPHRAKTETLTDEESHWLNYTLEVQRPPEEIVNLIFESAMELAKSNIPSQVTDAVIVTYSSALD